MKSLTTLGRILFAVAITAFGIQYFVYASRGSGLGPPFTPENHQLAYLAGVVCLLAGAALMTRMQAQLAAIILATAFLLRAVLYYGPKLVAALHNPGPWTSGSELLALGGASFVLASILARGQSGNSSRALFLAGRILIAGSLVVFGVQHFLYAQFIATLIPKWIPGALFWAYFVGGAFVGSALAIASGKLAALAATLLGTMFGLWVLILHAPRVATTLHNGNEWTSLLVALAMSGSSFLIAGRLDK
jgi:uncharacterized membrane protein